MRLHSLRISEGTSRTSLYHDHLNLNKDNTMDVLKWVGKLFESSILTKYYRQLRNAVSSRVFPRMSTPVGYPIPNVQL